MHAHQIITGALNNGENVYSIGNIEGLTFTACAVGTDVVILDSNFDRVQVIPGKSRFLVSSISCCQETGKIAATCGKTVKILEAISSGVDKNELKSLIFQFTWIETHSFTNNDPISSVLWTMEGMRILFVIENKLILHQHKNITSSNESAQTIPVTFCISYEDIKQGCPWDAIWTTALPFKPKFIRYSPDGFYLAVSGEKDCFIKIYYESGKEEHGIHFSTVTLPHPAPICGFEWRKTGRYMPKKCIHAVLMSWCIDKTSRIWKESPPPETSIIDLTGESGGEPLWDRQKTKKFLGKHMTVRKARTKILKKLKNLIPEKKSEIENEAIGLRAQIGKVPSSFDIQFLPRHEQNEFQFHLAATINAETDCLLVPSINDLILPKTFCVHWLNNKELVFSVGAEKLLAEAVLMDIQESTEVNATNRFTKIGKKVEIDREKFDNIETNGTHSISSDTLSSKDILDVKLEILLRQWTKTNDVLFAIHPVDGSLLTWTIEWLDDSFRQPIVSYSSRLPCALPSSDSLSIHSTLNTFNPHEPVYLDALRNDADTKDNYPKKLNERRVSNTIHVLTSHDNGTLNLWHMSVDDQSGFSHISNITHISRMCGHRFQMQQIVAHPVLPLLLTTSHCNSSTTHDESSVDILSEVILWKITPVGPLCQNGGVKELARVANSKATGFKTVGWVPVILPSWTLGTACNSPSSCFISFDGAKLVIYQAVLDARGLLFELTNSNSCKIVDENSKLTKCQEQLRRNMNDLNVVSTQSTAKPGCVLEVGRIENADIKNADLIFLHVFQSEIVSLEKPRLDNSKELSNVIDRSETTFFKDVFYVVLLDRRPDEDILFMFQVTISSQEEKHQKISSRKLNFEGQLVCRQVLSTPGARIKKMAPTAGHLSSASLYPACNTPYVLISSDDDDSVRFWTCKRIEGSSNIFKWYEWQMIGENASSELGIEGSIIDISAAHSGRFACAYKTKNLCEATNSRDVNVEITVFECESSGGVEWLREDSFSIKKTNSWKLSEKFYKDTSQFKFLHETTSIDSPQLELDDLIRLAWVSTEDGSHMLTVAMGRNVYIYAQISHDPAQQNVTLMKESETTMRRPSLRKASSLLPNFRSHSRFTKWMCCRILVLNSADGLPPIPSAISWVRDGILIIGMQSEMRVYNQWNFKTTEKESCNLQKQENDKVIALSISSSHAMLDRLIKRKEPLTSNHSRSFLEFMNKKHFKDDDPSMVLETLKNEGAFEAARLCSPILPQYHPKQLIALLNAGKKRRVKAILNHVLITLKRCKGKKQNPLSRAASLKRLEVMDQEKTNNHMPRIDDENFDYDEMEEISLLPLHTLYNIDEHEDLQNGECLEKSTEKQDDSEYNELFTNCFEKEGNIDELLENGDAGRSSSRHISVGSNSTRQEITTSSTFTARDSKKLTEILTHSHLPGLSSVDQMHLLAIADTLSHFTNDGKNKLDQANAALQLKNESVLGNAAAGGYATAAAGIDSVDECGLKYLMAMKQHEYLLVCLPFRQRLELKKNGLSAADIIWAQHSETETELLNAIPGLQKANISWEELKGLGIAWWLKNTSSLKICIEKLAKAAFQSNQDPMDAALFYLAMRKKNILTHLFKTVGNQKMAEFFMNDFNTDRWKNVAAKNAFVLMSKQRFQHAAAFFLLSGSLKDAIQTIISKCNDLQLALVVTRLFEADGEEQQSIIKSILCREVLGVSPEEFKIQNETSIEDETHRNEASNEPFERSMAFWMMKDYSRAAYTLVQEAQSDRHNSTLSDIFNFYSFLRKHPLVVRQRLNNAGVQVGSTEKFLVLGKQLESILTPPERRLFFRTAAEHMARGCPMLSLDVLNLLPKQINIIQDYDEALRNFFHEKHSSCENIEATIDWSAVSTSKEVEELELDWSDDESEAKSNSSANEESAMIKTKNSDEKILSAPNLLQGSSDIFAQHLKFVASLQILTEELSTLASGVGVDGIKLRVQLMDWLRNEIEVLKANCDYNNDVMKSSPLRDSHIDKEEHTSLNDRAWLKSNQKLLRSFTSFCTLHSAQNHKLPTVLMELLILLLDIQHEKTQEICAVKQRTFPLFEAATSSRKMFVSSPLAYIENQCYDLLTTIDELTTVPNMKNDLKKCYMLYNLSQEFSSCLYQSLCELENEEAFSTYEYEGAEKRVNTPPVKWPGAEDLIALLGREMNEDSPHLRILIAEAFFAITMSLFCFALSTYDSRWLYRLLVNEIDPFKFGTIFGGGGCHDSEIKMKPPRPVPPKTENTQRVEDSGEMLRHRLNLRVLGNDKFSSLKCQGDHIKSNVLKWISPKKSIVQFFTEKPETMLDDCTETYDTDEEDKEDVVTAIDEEENSDVCCENSAYSSFSWQLLRLAALEQQLYRFKQFLILIGIDPHDVPTIAPKIDCILKQLSYWINQQQEILNNFPGGVPADLLPDTTIDSNDQHLATTMKKYAALVKKNNTPFEADDKKVKTIKRLWAYLAKEDHLQETFIKYIFSQQNTIEQLPDQIDGFLSNNSSSHLPDAFKIVQKDAEPILAFSCNQESPGLIVVSNGRELQEMDMSNIFLDQSDQLSWMWNRADLDVKSIHSKRDAMRENDDYQIFSDSDSLQNMKNTTVIMKRSAAGIRRIDSHPYAPFYVTGSSDGSIKVWKWGTKDAVYTARSAGQHAKVTKVSFSCNGNKFAAVDGDGMLCLWQANQSTDLKKPFFSQRCHNKSASDVRFLGYSSSVLLTAGCSSLDFNLGLWDTLLPTSRSLVHSWVAHPEGATCAMYLPNQQTIFSGGRHGEICLWDIRQRQLRTTIKAFDQAHIVKNLVTDLSQDLIVCGSSEGDIKIWSADSNPQLMYSLPGEHTSRTSFSFRQVGQSSLQGVQQLFVDQNMRLFSCGADSSLKFRTLPSVFNMTNLL